MRLLGKFASSVKKVTAVSIMTKNVKYLRVEGKTLSPTKLFSGMSHYVVFVTSPSHNKLINYCVKGIELFQKLYIGLDYMPKDMGKSS